MTYKSILLVVGVKQFEGDLRAAADLCSAHDVHLTVMPVAMATLPPIRDFAAVSWDFDRTSQIEEVGQAIERAREALNNSGISFNVLGRYADSMRIEHDLGECARFSDITLIGPSLRADKRLRRLMIEGVLFHSARPILLAPDLRSATLKPKRVLLAWNSSIESARAAREGLELMRGADGVNVVVVEPRAVAETGVETGDDIASYLARHGITVTIDRLRGAGRRTEEVLNQHAVDTSADLIVMGAYGHSRVREKVFGGVTQAMIDAQVVPVMLVR
ncbi:universal stress protein (plasmid) [Ensifer sp. D2-11]